MAKLTEGSATMRVNDALEEDEVEDGYVLTCQAIPDTQNVDGQLRRLSVGRVLVQRGRGRYSGV